MTVLASKTSVSRLKAEISNEPLETVISTALLSAASYRASEKPLREEAISQQGDYLLFKDSANRFHLFRVRAFENDTFNTPSKNKTFSTGFTAAAYESIDLQGFSATIGKFSSADQALSTLLPKLPKTKGTGDLYLSFPGADFGREDLEATARLDHGKLPAQVTRVIPFLQKIFNENSGADSVQIIGHSIGSANALWAKVALTLMHPTVPIAGTIISEPVGSGAAVRQISRMLGTLSLHDRDSNGLNSSERSVNVAKWLLSDTASIVVEGISGEHAYLTPVRTYNPGLFGKRSITNSSALGEKTYCVGVPGKDFANPDDLAKFMPEIANVASPAHQTHRTINMFKRAQAEPGAVFSARNSALECEAPRSAAEVMANLPISEDSPAGVRNNLVQIFVQNIGLKGPPNPRGRIDERHLLGTEARLIDQIRNVLPPLAYKDFVEAKVDKVLDPSQFAAPPIFVSREESNRADRVDIRISPENPSASALLKRIINAKPIVGIKVSSRSANELSINFSNLTALSIFLSQFGADGPLHE